MFMGKILLLPFLHYVALEALMGLVFMLSHKSLAFSMYFLYFHILQHILGSTNGNGNKKLSEK